MKLRDAIEAYMKEPVEEMFFFIKKEGDKHCVKSHRGQSLGCYDTASGARKRLKQVEYYKHKDVKASETYYGPNTNMGPAKALDPE